MLIQNVCHAVGHAVEATERVDYLLAKGQHGRKLGSDSVSQNVGGRLWTDWRTRWLLRERAGRECLLSVHRFVTWITLGQGRAQAVTKHRQPLDGLVAEDQPQVSRRDRASPCIRHGRCGDLVVE
jgi:hypothetical protein